MHIKKIKEITLINGKIKNAKMQKYKNQNSLLIFEIVQSSIISPMSVFARLLFPAHGSHRGGRGSYAPENTMYAYRKAVHESSTAILEFDLQLSKDGTIVLCHNE